jgi:hypothetical protein
MEDAGAEDAKVAEARHLPYNQRLADKNWKIRRDAYEDIKGACNGNSQPDGSYGDRLSNHQISKSIDLRWNRLDDTRI